MLLKSGLVEKFGAFKNIKWESYTGSAIFYRSQVKQFEKYYEEGKLLR